MKKWFLTLLVIFMSCPSWAQSYRGFVDVTAGLPVGSAKISDVSLDRLVVFGGLLTSHGCQVMPNIYVGAGTGFMATTIEFGSQLPLFADVRYDMWGNRGVGFYAGLRLGYSITLKSGDSYEYFDGPQWFSCGLDDWLYVQPSVGMRIKLGSRTGLNIGLSYLPLRIKPTDGYWNWNYSASDEVVTPVKGKTVVSNLMLSVGVDF